MERRGKGKVRKRKERIVKNMGEGRKRGERGQGKRGKEGRPGESLIYEGKFLLMKLNSSLTSAVKQQRCGFQTFEHHRSQGSSPGTQEELTPAGEKPQA